MTINKDAWAKIAKKYDTKAKWADAILMLNTADHDDIISALIELDPSELAGPRSVIKGNSTTNAYIQQLDESKVSYNKADAALEEAKSLMEQVDVQTSQIQEDLADLKNLMENTAKVEDSSLVDLILNFNSDKLPDPQEVIRLINRELGRDI